MTTSSNSAYPLPVPKPLVLRAQDLEVACLSSLDDLMAAQSDKLEALKTQKKVLMQRLFPYPAEARSVKSTDSKVAGASSSRSGKREQGAPATLWEYFNPLTEIDIRTGGALPHWEQGSVWYFVTFRLADALPRAVIIAARDSPRILL